MPTPFFYVATAFAGKVLDAKEPPVDDVIRLLDLYEESGESVPASNALLPYWRLWGEQRHMKALAKRFEGLGDKAEERWGKLTVLSKRWRSLPSWATARAAYVSKPLPATQGSGSPWGSRPLRAA